MLRFGGVTIYENADLTVPGPEDWSRVRSPGRARRRRKQGHRQNIRQTTLPNPDSFMIGDKLFMHPATAARFRREWEKQFPERV